MFQILGIQTLLIKQGKSRICSQLLSRNTGGTLLTKKRHVLQDVIDVFR